MLNTRAFYEHQQNYRDRYRDRDRNNIGLRHEKLDVYRLSMKQKINNNKRNGTVLSPG